MRDCSVNGVVLTRSQHPWNDLQWCEASFTNLVTCCSGRRPAWRKPNRGNILFSVCYLLMSGVICTQKMPTFVL
jgi:hypothetical protein